MHIIDLYLQDPSANHFEPATPTEPRIVERLRKVAEAPGALNAVKKIIWNRFGVATNSSYNSTNRYR